MTETGLPEGRVPVLRLLALPSDANQGGSIFGGWIMSQVDIAGSIPAQIRARGAIVTRAVDSFEFKQPVFVGDLVACYARITETGRTSIKVHVEVYAQQIQDGMIGTRMVTEANLVYVAIDENRCPRALPQE